MPEPSWSDPYATLYQGDCRAVLVGLPRESIQVVVTSPPFWGLRRYAGEQDLVWGDAWQGAYGLEPTPEMYVEHTIEIFRAIRRVLRPDGVVFWHLADSYMGSGQGWAKAGKDTPGPLSIETRPDDMRPGRGEPGARGRPPTAIYNHSIIKPKDLCLIPERVMLAAQADGWWVRSRIAWVKPNPMPESVTDRPTDAWDYIIMLTKSANYFWDMEAVREGHTPGTLERWGRNPQRALASPKQHRESYNMTDFSSVVSLTGRNLRNVWTMATEGFGLEMCRACGRIYEPRQYQDLPGEGSSHGIGEYWDYEPAQSEESFKRVCRCGASDFLSHFATFPLELPTKCILAATSEKGNCPKCGKPWERVIQHNRPPGYKPSEIDQRQHNGTGGLSHNRPLTKIYDTSLQSTIETLGWQPQCSCGEAPTPALVLDPFAGSGTTLLAAKRLGRRGIGIDLSPQYLKLAQYRLEGESLPLQDLSGKEML